jgi:hypothetical protein
MSMSKSRDNIPGIILDRPWKFLLIPGVVIQWFMYMNPQRGFQGIARTSRRARSPILTYCYSVTFYIGVIWLLYALYASGRH